MLIIKLYVENIRAIQKKEIDFKSGINVVWGQNGTGKTTILECVHILSVTKSFRQGKNVDIIAHNSPMGIINGFFNQKQTIKTIIDKKQKTFYINNTQTKPSHELIGKAPTVVLSPEDIDIVSGGNTLRLRFIDKILSTTDKQYFFALRELKKVLKQRNKALSQGNNELVELWNTPFYDSSLVVWQKRDAFFLQFRKLFKDSWNSTPNNHTGNLVYNRKQINTKDEFVERLNSKLERDIILKTTTTGPHKDKIEFMLNSKTLKEFGSQGEKKLFLTNLKFSEAEYIKKTTNKEPLLLLDDLFEKLDVEKINHILSKAKNFKQTIITTTDNSIKSIEPYIKGLNKIQLQHV